MAMGMGAQALASVTGNVETALLVIHDRRAVQKEAAAQAQPTIPKLGKLAGVAKAAGKLKVPDVRSVLVNGTAPSVPNSSDKIFQVQFNPSRLMLNASAKPQSKTDTRTQGARTMAPEDADLYLTTELIFDNVNIFDAFMFEKFNASAVAMAGNLASSIVGAVKGSGPPTVKPQVEALVAALRDPATRLVSFRWADFTFIGNINTVIANYTMFSPAGHPIRAEVQLRLQHVQDPNYLQQWYKNFEVAFVNSGGNLAKAAQKVGNILNIGI